MAARERTFIGLAAGRAADGADAALLAVRGRGQAMKACVLAAAHRDYPEPLSRRIRAAACGLALRPADLAALDKDVSLELSAAGHAMAVQARGMGRTVAAVGCWGQALAATASAGPGDSGASVEVGNPAVLAAQIGLPVVGALLAGELAAGGLGGGALAWADWLMWRDRKLTRAVVHLGGIASVAFLPAGAPCQDVLAFDAGPGTIAIDGLARTMLQRPFDDDGLAAAAGSVNAALLNELLAHPFFQLPPPKRARMDDWSDLYAQRLAMMADKHGCRGEDLLTTVTELTVCVVAAAVGALTERPHQVILTGGGARNIHLAVRIRALLSPSSTISSQGMGIDVQSHLAVCAALLGAARMDGVPAGFQGAGGARQAVVGSVTLM